MYKQTHTCDFILSTAINSVNSTANLVASSTIFLGKLLEIGWIRYQWIWLMELHQKFTRRTLWENVGLLLHTYAHKNKNKSRPTSRSTFSAILPKWGSEVEDSTRDELLDDPMRFLRFRQQILIMTLSYWEKIFTEFTEQNFKGHWPCFWLLYLHLTSVC